MLQLESRIHWSNKLWSERQSHGKLQDGPDNSQRPEHGLGQHQTMYLNTSSAMRKSTRICTKGTKYNQAPGLWPSFLHFLCKLSIEIVHRKLISRSKKEMKNFIRAKFKDYNLRRTSQKAPFHPFEVKVQLYVSFLRQRAGHQMTCYWQFTSSRTKCHLDSPRWPLTGSGRNAIF